MHRSKLWTRTGGVIVAAAVVIAIVAAQSASTQQHSGQQHSGQQHSGQVATAAQTAAAADETCATGAAPTAKLPALDRQQLAGQRIIYSYSGHNPPASLLWLISHGDAAGVIFFGANISSEAQIRGVIKRLDQANAAKTNPVRRPLLLMTDQEGGEVRRLPGAPSLSEKQIGESAHPGTAATAAGKGAGQNLRGVGMNVNLAPVLDVYRKPGNFIDEFGRSYSSNPSIVAALGPDFIKAQQKLKVAATAKHFPGLGKASRSQDTDIRPVTLNLTLHSIRTIDEKPYTTAIAAGVKLVMVSWAVYPVLDKNRPAGLSSTIVGGELRDRLAFKGVTVTDALEAGALHAFGSIPNRAVLAAGAGMDLLLCAAQQVGEGSQARDALAHAYGGKLGKAAFTAAAGRIFALRGSLG